MSAAVLKDMGELRRRLKVELDSTVTEALYLASRSLVTSLSRWFENPDDKKGNRIESALVAYWSRLTGRSTPTGLMAGVSVGTTTGRATTLRLGPVDAMKRQLVLDSRFLMRLCDAVNSDPEARLRIMYSCNSTMNAMNSHVALIARSSGGGNVNERTYDATECALDEALEMAIRGASGRTTLPSLVKLLTGSDNSAHEEVTDYVASLVDSDVLVTSIEPPLTVSDPERTLLGELEAVSPSAHALLSSAIEQADAISREPLGVSPDTYERARSILPMDSYPSLAGGDVWQAHLSKCGGELTLGREVLKGVEKALRAAMVLRRRVTGPWENFKKDFIQRYEDRTVGLLDVLDQRRGMPFALPFGRVPEELFVGLKIAPQKLPRAPDWGRTERLLFRAIVDGIRAGDREIRVPDTLISEGDEDAAGPLPSCIAVLCSLIADSEDAVNRGDFRVLLENVGDAISLIARFCRTHPDLQKELNSLIQHEEGLRPDTVFAEVVHWPVGEYPIANVLWRPALRRYEIPVLGRSGAPQDSQLALSDLRVAVRDDRVILLSDRLQKEVVPCNDTAHSYDGARQLPIYQFLSNLRRQDMHWSPTWIHPVFSEFQWLPRIVNGRSILLPATWNLDDQRLKTFRVNGAVETYDVVSRWRDEERVPRYVALVDGDKKLPFDLDNVLSVKSFARHIRKRSRATVSELLTDEGQLCVTGPSGRFAHELVVPFLNHHRAKGVEEPQPALGVARIRGQLKPGSECLYTKLFVAEGGADDVLLALAPTLAALKRRGTVVHWHFLRYTEDGHHLRLRLFGDAKRLWKQAPEAIELALRRHELGVSRIQYDTYDREVARYGGPDSLLSAEAIFAVDSFAVIKLIRVERAGADIPRWAIALQGIDRLLGDFGLDLDERVDLLEGVLKQLRTTFAPTKADHSLIAAKMREYRPTVRHYLALDSGQVTEAWIERSRELVGILEGLHLTPAQPGWRLFVTSILHLHVNRVLWRAQTGNEMLLYDLLLRDYRSRLALKAEP